MIGSNCPYGGVLSENRRSVFESWHGGRARTCLNRDKEATRKKLDVFRKRKKAVATVLEKAVAEDALQCGIGNMRIDVDKLCSSTARFVETANLRKFLEDHGLTVRQRSGAIYLIVDTAVAGFLKQMEVHDANSAN